MRAEATAPDAPDLIVALTCGSDTGLVAAAAQARALGVGVAAVLAGPAAAAATELAAGGVDVVVVSGSERIAAVLSGARERARVS
jgi:precorrin-6B methylase 2